jgi:hypothetical protein
MQTLHVLDVVSLVTAIATCVLSIYALWYSRRSTRRSRSNAAVSCRNSIRSMTAVLSLTSDPEARNRIANSILDVKRDLDDLAGHD